MKKQLQEIPRGGLKFDEYIDPEFMYEVQDRELAQIIRDFTKKYFGPLKTLYFLRGHI